MPRKYKKRKYPTARIYYGPPGHERDMYWTVRVTDAKKKLTITGSAAAALRAYPGVTIGCAMSNNAIDCRKDIEKQVGHPVLLAAFYRTTLLLVDRRNKDGSPAHAFRYSHSYGDIVDSNDDGSLKEAVKANPAIIERPFHLGPPQKRKVEGTHSHESSTGAKPIPKRAYVPRGALARAVKAGFISKGAARQLAEVAKDQE